jgi:hypothetical protein
VNHIAIGRALSPGGELLPPHHRRQGDGSGGTSPSRQGAETETSVSQNSSVVAVELQTLLEILPIVLGFSIGRPFLGEGASSGVDQGGLTTVGRGQGLGRAPSS